MKRQIILEILIRKMIVTQITRIVLKYYSYVLPDLLFSLRLFDVFRRISFLYPESTSHYVQNNYAGVIDMLYRYITDTFVSTCFSYTVNTEQDISTIVIDIDNEILPTRVECLYMYLTDYAVLHNAHMFCDYHTLLAYRPVVRNRICKAVETLEGYGVRPMLDILLESKDTEPCIVVEWTYV